MLVCVEITSTSVLLQLLRLDAQFEWVRVCVCVCVTGNLSKMPTFHILLVLLYYPEFPRVHSLDFKATNFTRRK